MSLTQIGTWPCFSGARKSEDLGTLADGMNGMWALGGKQCAMGKVRARPAL